ncbi:hypothetical protein [Demequina sp.]|uniref:hypothetical protein n=1 Tax=Demequina sp. TaxID=2050685 RepID=UPI003D11F841
MKTLRWVLLGAGVLLVVALGLVWANLNVGPGPNGYVSKHEGVQFYPACGNDVLEFEGKTWYSISRDDWETPSAQAAVTEYRTAASGGRGAATGVRIVAAPGPGDDVGTLYVYRDGRAYWVSDSGALDTWLTLVPQTYNWVC